MPRLSDLGERALVHRLLAIFQGEKSLGLGDDAAAIPVGDRYLLLTTDVIHGRTHIPQGTPAEEVGWYAGAVNLSDIAAMGGEPFALLGSFSLPTHLEAAQLEAMAEGFHACAQAYGADVVGGDTKESPDVSVSGTAAGWTRGRRVLRRVGSSPGDLLGVTGHLGRAGWGLFRLAEGEAPKEAFSAVMHPEPRIREGLLLAAEEGVTSCMDISDGLAASLSQLADVNGVTYGVEYEQLPRDPRLSQMDPAGEKETLLFQGGDFELLFTCLPEAWDSLQAAFGEETASITRIGEVREGGQNVLGREGEEETLEARGYEHFR